ncbi:hypothetical protein WG922_15420 [Ramlibacter sp. AN1015]|uniref:hypothetical protein n=1 Tax=Ramlibacter sp. AN1015 TaxID=3133428 RepID=UPI0030BF18B5
MDMVGFLKVPESTGGPGGVHGIAASVLRDTDHCDRVTCGTGNPTGDAVALRIDGVAAGKPGGPDFAGRYSPSEADGF